jgi:hypothetical protein
MRLSPAGGGSLACWSRCCFLVLLLLLPRAEAFFPTLFKAITAPFSKQAMENPPANADAVLVLGATGKLGVALVNSLLETGKPVVAAVRNQTRASELLPTHKSVFFRELSAGQSAEDLFQGCSQVVSCIGPGMSREPGQTSEAVDFKMNMKFMALAQAAGLSERVQGKELGLVQFAPDDKEALSRWRRLDDVIMGGRSESGWSITSEGSDTFGRFSGILRVEGGGFCGSVIQEMPFNASGYDGVRLRIRGDGNRYKFRLKPTALEQVNEMQYQASFDTQPGQWMCVDLPFEKFVQVRRNDVNYDAPPVAQGPSKGAMSSIGIVFSRFEFNEMANPKCTPGNFQLDVKEISLYRSKRPAFVLVSSAGAERYNRLSPEGRKADIPIIRLNPGGILNWKYKAESALRKAGDALPYTIVRPCGLLPKTDQVIMPVRLEVFQGDTVSGRITREEVAQFISFVLGSPHSEGKTMEIRRGESEDSVGVKVDPFKSLSLLSPLVRDCDRSVSGLKPLPYPQDPPPPPTPEEVQAILNDARVQAQQTRDAPNPPAARSSI